ncbi:MAG: hypothetical protein HETSPECPRED_003281 [Heterodermia speciosa]|uniref:Uncharacterized protein n=1 Tax=Heterodermia speciosa TaxID=116794 RepID=A0A8H3EEV8_9LECA|nr:MAG: hypothetical protein HETSPECPRED_003281 [Heterodermia speciosa]
MSTRRPQDPTQLIDVHLPLPAVRTRSRSLSQKILAACSSIYPSRAHEPGPSRPLVNLEASVSEDRSQDDSKDRGSKHVHRAREQKCFGLGGFDGADEDESGNGDVTGKGKGKESDMDDWDRTVWKRWSAEQEQRRKVEREAELHRRRRLPSIREQIEEASQEHDHDEDNESYADIHSIDALEASSQSRPSSSAGHLNASSFSTSPGSRSMSRGIPPSGLPHPDADSTTTASRRTIRKRGTTAICAGSSRSESATTLLTERRLNVFRRRTRREVVPAKGHGSQGFGDAEQTESCVSGSIIPVTEEEYCRFEEEYCRFEEEYCRFEEGGFEHDEENPAPVLRLRGGAGGGNSRKSMRLEDDARVPAGVWFLAGRMGPPPTGKELRDRRAKEEAYLQRTRAEAEAQREARKAKREHKKSEGKGKGKGGKKGGFWKNMFGKKKKKKNDKTRGDEEAKNSAWDDDAEEKELADDY